MSQFDEIKDILKNITASQAKTDKQLKELATLRAATEARFAETDKKLGSRKHKRIYNVAEGK